MLDQSDYYRWTQTCREAMIVACSQKQHQSIKNWDDSADVGPHVDQTEQQKAQLDVQPYFAVVFTYESIVFAYESIVSMVVMA